MVHCCSYDDLRAVDTSIALEVLARAQEYGTVLPTNITLRCSFVQLAADNNDINEETLDGKNTTHATTMVVYQKKQFGPEPPLMSLAQHGKRRQSLQADESDISLQECSVYRGRPVTAEYVGHVDVDWYSGESDTSRSASLSDDIWKVLRLNDKGLTQSFVTTASEIKPIPSWSGFDSILFPDMPRVTSIGYCPMIEGASTEFSTIYTVLKHAQAISSTVDQEDTVITFDLAMYVKATQLQWRFPNEFSDPVIRLGGFHIALNYLALLGKKYASSGLDDLLVELGVYAAGTASALMKGKFYNRGIWAHNIAMEALFHLKWCAFLLWYQSKYGGRIILDEEHLMKRIKECVAVFEKKKDVGKSVHQLGDNLSGVFALLEELTLSSQATSQMFAFWEEYLSMVNILLQFIKAERTADWSLHLATVAAMLPHFAMDCPTTQDGCQSM